MADNQTNSSDSEDKIDITFKDEEPIKKPQAIKSAPAKKPKLTKQSKPQKTEKPKEEGSTALLVIIIILIIAAGVYLIVTNYSAFNGEPAKTSQEEIVAEVNDEIISENDLNEVYAQLSPQIKMFFDKEAVLQRLIEQKLLLQEAQAQGIEITEEEINRSLEQLISTLPEGLSLDEFLRTQNLTMDELKVDIEKQLAITSLLNRTVITEVKITEEDAREFFDNNPEYFEDMEFEDIKEQLTNELVAEEQQVKSEEYLEELKSKAVIVNRYDKIKKQETFVACAEELGVEDDIIFLTDDSCQFSNEMVPIVMKLNSQSASFRTLQITNIDNELFDTCVKPLIEDFAVPQFICTSTGKVKRGNMPEAELISFAESCS